MLLSSTPMTPLTLWVGRRKRFGQKATSRRTSTWLYGYRWVWQFFWCKKYHWLFFPFPPLFWCFALCSDLISVPVRFPFPPTISSASIVIRDWWLWTPCPCVPCSTRCHGGVTCRTSWLWSASRLSNLSNSAHLPWTVTNLWVPHVLGIGHSECHPIGLVNATR